MFSLCRVSFAESSLYRCRKLRDEHCATRYDPQVASFSDVRDGYNVGRWTLTVVSEWLSTYCPCHRIRVLWWHCFRGWMACAC